MATEKAPFIWYMLGLFPCFHHNDTKRYIHIETFFVFVLEVISLSISLPYWRVLVFSGHQNCSHNNAQPVLLFKFFPIYFLLGLSFPNLKYFLI